MSFEELVFTDWFPVYIRTSVELGEPVLRANESGSYLDILRLSGLEIAQLRMRDERLAAESIQRLLSQGSPVPVLVDTYTLEYYSTAPRHSLHWIILYQYDPLSDVYRVVDPSPRQMYRGEIPRVRLAQAMALPADRFPIAGYNLIAMPCGQQRPIVHGDLIKQKILDNSNIVCEGRRQCVPERASRKANWGLPAIGRLAADLLNWHEIHDTDALRIRLAELAEGQKAVAGRLYGYACFLKVTGTRTLGNDRALVEIADALETMSDSWFVPGHMLMKGSLGEARAMLPRVSRRLESLAASTAALFEDLRNAL